MGCTNSKLDDLPAVALCRERCAFLDEAIHQRYVLADTHVAYVHSLKQVGHSLHNFITNQDYTGHVGGVGSPLSPKLNLPTAKKGGGDLGGIKIQDTTSSSAVKGHHSHSNSSGHIQFHSDPEEDDSGSGSSFSGHSSPLRHHLHDNHDDNPAPVPGPGFGFGDIDYGNYGNFNQMMSMDQETLGGYNSQNTHTHMNYMKSQAKPSVVYERKPAQNYHVGESSASSSSYYPNSYPYQYPTSSPGPGPGPGPGSAPAYSYGGGGVGAVGYYGYPPPYGSPTPPPPAGPGASSSKPPPPPPSPPRASAWDFLNPFESYEKYYQQYNTPSRDSKELREEEGIPDLEDDEFQHEVVKKVHGDGKFMDGGGGVSGGGGAVDDEEDGHIGGGSSDDAEASLYQTRPGVDEGDEYVVEKKVVDEERNEERSNAARPRSRDAVDVSTEIEVQFERASDSGSEIAKMLEVGRFPYQRKYASKMLHVVTPSLSVVSSQPSTSKSAESSSSTNKGGPAYLDIDEDMAMRTRSLSATLQKLYLWEKKLYHEVKAEEKMRVLHDRKVRKLKRLDERGAEPHKVDDTRSVIRSLSVKIGMAIQVVDKISVTINKIRDEELWPQINELIQGLTRMWKNMLECHRIQCQAIREAKNLSPSSKKLGDAHLHATSQLGHELLNWITRFSTWIGSQKGYVKALNSWLLKCILYEPEETPDGIVPFSPGRMGAPPIFVICNQWFQALDRISEKEVIDSMHVFAMSVLQLWEHDKLEIRQKMGANKDYERKVRNLDREDQRLQKELQALDKKIILVSGDGDNQLVSGHAVYQSDTGSGSLQGSLQRIFEAMERFTDESVKAYEELLQRAEEERPVRGNERNS